MRAKREPLPEPAAEVVEPGSARYFAWLYADAGRRELLSTLLGIEREIESSLRPGLEHQVAHMRLAWWQEECDRFARGTPVHPTTRRLLQLAGSCADAVKLHGLVDSVAWDLAAAPCETRNALEQHCERWADAVIVPFAVCGPNAVRADAALAQSARSAGRALREIELLLRLAPDARRGRLRLPLDELDSLGIEPRALANPPWPEPLNAWMRQRYEALRGSLRGAFATLDPPARRETSALA
ncbi:MAG: squalene/phytoene synthase family protein, partial [Steroidobacteraceae bacterium]